MTQTEKANNEAPTFTEHNFNAAIEKVPCRIFDIQQPREVLISAQLLSETANTIAQNAYQSDDPRLWKIATNLAEQATDLLQERL